MNCRNLWIALLALAVIYPYGAYAENCGDDCGGGLFQPPPNPLLFPVDDNPASFIEPTSMPETSTAETFNLKELIGTSINGMLDKSCGGYCIIGFCAHLKLGFSLTRGFYYYTIISPRIRSTLPELLIMSFDEVGDQPFKEWRDTFGKVIATANGPASSIIGITDGLQGGRPDPIRQGQHQTVSFKEVDIIGHPLALLPELVNDQGASTSDQNYKLPNYASTAYASTTLDNNTQESLSKSGFGFSPGSFKWPSLDSVTDSIKQKVNAAIQSMQVIDQLNSVKSATQTVKNIKKTVNVALEAAEVSVRSSGWLNFTRPRFRAPRLFCDATTKPFQPYYISFLDAFWWRSGYPITDGPISGTDKSKVIINPLSTDTLQKVSSPLDVMKKEIWGHLYPRDGSINQSHDAKTGSVIAWRGLDVLRTAVRSGHRVGVPLKDNTPGKWQLIFPEVKSCRNDPYYPQGADLSIDSLKPSGYGGYAWNYYKTSTCCSNTSGTKIGQWSGMPAICLQLGDVLAGIEEDRAAYEQWLKMQEEQIGDK